MTPFLLISRVHQSYIGKFLQTSPNFVKHPISIFHLMQLSVIASGDHLLSQNMIKHLMPIYQNHCFDPFYYSPLPQILTTCKPDHLLPPVTHPCLSSIIGGGKTPFYSSGQQLSPPPSLPPHSSGPPWHPRPSHIFLQLPRPPEHHWANWTSLERQGHGHAGQTGALERATVP